MQHIHCDKCDKIIDEAETYWRLNVIERRSDKQDEPFLDYDLCNQCCIELGNYIEGVK